MSHSKTNLLLYLLTVLLFDSCQQAEIKQPKTKNELANHGVLYYYRNYHCFDFVKRCELELVKLKNLDTLIYVASSQFHGSYDEIHGKLTPINDSIYFVKTYKHILQSGNGAKPVDFEKDTLFFYGDSSLIHSTLTIEYLNGLKEQHQIYSTENKFHVNGQYFNEQHDRIYLTLDHKNPIVDEAVEITSTYSSPKYVVSFTSVKKTEDFYILVTKKQILTLNSGSGSHQSSGPIFMLDRMTPGTALPGRRLYE